MSTTPHVVVLGGGFAGLETIFYLRHKLGDRVDLTLVSDQQYFLFKPNTIYIPFGADPEQFKIDLARPTRRKHINLVIARAQDLDLAHQQVATDTGAVDYDYLVVATGAAMRPQEIPGLAEHALTPWTPDEMLQLRQGLQRLVEHAQCGVSRKLLFLVPPNNKCSGPLYELVLMTHTWLEQQGVRDDIDITWSTFEESYIQAFGPRLNTVVAEEFAARGIQGHIGFVVTGVEPGVVQYQNGERLPYDLLVSFPPYIAKERFAGLPLDDRGFIHVDPDSRRVKGLDTVFAVGDAADFPIKQAFLALLQGDAAADHLAAVIAGRGAAAAARFEPMSMCVMEELNKATFAQVPLKYTDDPTTPVAVDTSDPEHYRVGVSPLWRVGKKILGLYLPWRFGSGEPFHAGFAWEAMDLGLKVMARVMAR
jgi:NADH dehydrogenase FAD-containing subunit